MEEIGLFSSHGFDVFISHCESIREEPFSILNDWERYQKKRTDLYETLDKAIAVDKRIRQEASKMEKAKEWWELKKFDFVFWYAGKLWDWSYRFNSKFFEKRLSNFYDSQLKTKQGE